MTVGCRNASLDKVLFPLTGVHRDERASEQYRLEGDDNGPRPNPNAACPEGPCEPNRQGRNDERQPERQMYDSGMQW